ncbi:MAG: hypothetical protein ACK4TL_01395 [Hyphomicrobiaceae bacterium]
MREDEAAAIAEIHEQDVAEARALLQEAIKAAGERWLPMNAIVDAIVREVVVLQGRAPCVIRPAPLGRTDTAWPSLAWRAAKRS